MHIGVDVSALARSGDGIARYLGAILAHALAPDAPGHRWSLYGRARSDVPADAAVSRRVDHWPADIGGIAALATSLPLWTARDRPDLFWGPAHRLPLWLPARTARVVTIHDLCWRQAPETMRRATRWLDARLMPAALRQADRIIAVSDATARDLRDLFPQVAARVVVVPEAATTLPAPQPRAVLDALGLPPRYVLFVGTQEPRKNLVRLLHALAEVRAGGEAGLGLVIAGAPGWGDDEIGRTIDACGLREAVHRLGRVDDAQLATLYRHAQCLVMPSVYEGFGLPLLEAMQFETPVLTSNIASMPEVAGDAAVLVDPLSVASIADGLRRLLGDPALRRQLAARAPLQAARFSWHRAARMTLEVFDAALAQRRAARA